jgi:glycosyltransferase involved in cell wall biosynthesis
MTFTIAIPQRNAYRHTGGIGRVVQELCAAWGDEVAIIPAHFRASRLPLLRQIPTAVTTEGPADVIFLPQLTGAQALRQTNQTPGVVTVYDIGIIDVLADRQGTNWLSHQIVLQSLAGLSYATSIIVPSAFTRQRLIQHLPALAGRVHVVQLGVGAAFRHYQRSRTAARAAAEVLIHKPLGTPVLLYVGSELPRKNMQLLLQVFRQLVQRYPQAQLLKVGHAGATRWREQTIATAEELGIRQQLVLIEAVDDIELADLYAAADVFVTASLYEGFGLPVAEAMAIGTPVVTTNQGALPEVVANHGWVVEPRTDAFLAAIEQALATCEPDAQRQHRRQYAAQFSWEHAARQYLHVFAAAQRGRDRRAGSLVGVRDH